MKRTFLYLIGAALLLSACGGGNQEKKSQFQPKDRTSNNMTNEERDAALAAKRAELVGGLNVDSLFYGHGVRISIVQPASDGKDITPEIAEEVGVKMLVAAAANGISGMGTNPSFVMGANIAQTERAATGTSPQKITVQYDITYKVMNALTGDVYATWTQKVSGVGNSFEHATRNAVNSIKNTTEMQKMLQTASNRIVDWYNTNVAKLKTQVEAAEGQGDYALALAFVSGVPELATVAMQYVTEKQPELLKGMLHKQAAEMLGEMEALLASSGDEFNPAVGAYFSMIPTDAPEHEKAQQLYAEYEKACKARRAALEAKAERDEQAARDLQKLDMLYKHQEELAKYECEKMTAKYQAQAVAKQATSQKGFRGKLGDRIIGVTDRAIKGTDVLSAAIDDKFELGEYTQQVEENNIDY